jgi:hypothetical protein
MGFTSAIKLKTCLWIFAVTNSGIDSGVPAPGNAVKVPMAPAAMTQQNYVTIAAIQQGILFK